MPGSIPWLAIAEWSDRHGYGADELEWLAEIVGIMDVGYLDWWRVRNAN